MSPQSRKLSAETQLYWLPLFCKSDLNIRSVWIKKPSTGRVRSGSPPRPVRLGVRGEVLTSQLLKEGVV